MNVTILSSTYEPVDLISMAAGTCYGKTDISAKRVKACIDSGHLSVLEHASVTFLIEGISRACSHQLVRHRLASYSQQSQRYCKIDVDSHDWYVVPPDISDSGNLEAYRRYMECYAKAYKDFLNAGNKPEDARYLLPEACKTEIVMTMNAREIFHFLDLRQSKRSQWEIRELAYAIEGKLHRMPGWRFLIESRKDLFV